MYALTVVAVGVLGTLIGSFLNVVIYRLPRHESLLFPSSHCPNCDSPIKSRHNVPIIGWLVLRGRCAACRTSISARYPLVELSTGLLFAAVTARLGLVPYLPAFLFLAAVGIVIALIDVDGHALSGPVLLSWGLIGVALLLPAQEIDRAWHNALFAPIGAVAVACACFVAALVSQRVLDPTLLSISALVGLYLGWLSWTLAVLAAAIALSIGLLSLAGAPRLLGRHISAAMPMTTVVLASGALALIVPVPIGG